ncbi:MAG: Ig-like domain repeat protein [Roseburia sp.]|nr:Ig-like domain repeat protein [Roseburia sp.]
MRKQTFQTRNRVLALLIAAIMLLGMMPTTVHSMENEQTITLTVKSSDTEPVAVENATVSYNVAVDGVQSELVTAITNADGVAELDLSTYAQQVEAENISVVVSYTVSAEGFQDATGDIQVAAFGGNTDVTLTRQTHQIPCKVTFTVKQSNGTPVVGAAVSYTVNDGETTSEPAEAVTGDAGVVELDLTAYQGNLPVTISYTVSAEGFQSATGEFPVTAFGANQDVTLLQNGELPVEKAVTVTVTGTEGPVVNAQVRYRITAGEETSNEVSTVTGDDGVTKLDLTGYDLPVTLSYSVSAEGYQETPEASVEITAFGTDIPVQLTKLPEKVTLTFVINGSGKVLIDNQELTETTVEVNKGDEVKITLIPGDSDTHVDSILVGGQKVDELPASFEQNTQIEITFVTEYTITLKDPVQEGGTVTSSASVVTPGEEVTITAKATPGYQITKVLIGDAEMEIENPALFKYTFIPQHSITVRVTFIRAFSVKVIYDDNGTVLVNDKEVLSEGTVYIREEGNGITVEALPHEHYRVSDVKINGKAAEGFLPQNDKGYKTTLVYGDYDIEIFFELNVYEITVVPQGQGTVQVDPADGKVHYDGDATVCFLPEAGYMINGVTINGETVEPVVTETEAGDRYTYIIKNITEDKEVGVTFAKIPPLELKDVTISPNPIRTEVRDNQTIYVYGKGEVTIAPSTKKSSIKITYSNGAAFGGLGVNKVTIQNTVSISKIEIFNAKVSLQWQSVAGLTGKTLKIVVDTNAPQVDFGDIAECYNGDAVIVPTVTEPGIMDGSYSGIAKVQYFVSRGSADQNDPWITAYEAAENDFTGKYTLYPITIRAAEFTGNDICLSVKVTDWAGNEKTYYQQLAIRTKAPQVNVSVDGTSAEGAEEGYFNLDKRTATIEIDDADYAFNPNGLAVQDSNGHALTVVWDSENPKVATVAFTEEGAYDWTVTYTSKAAIYDASGKPVSNPTPDGEVVTDGESKSPYAFIIDRTAPKGTIGVEGQNGWSTLLSKLTFGLYSGGATVTANWTDESFEDAIVPAEKVWYYKVDSRVDGENAATLDENASTLEGRLLNSEELDEAFAAGEFTTEPYTVNAEEMFVVYSRVMDRAGNVHYISTEGIVIDTNAPLISLKVSSSQNGAAEENVGGKIFGSDVWVTICVNEAKLADGMDRGIYSGIQSIHYSITGNGKVESKDITFEQPSTVNQLKENGYYTTEPIRVDAVKFNSKDVRIRVTAVDYAGNKVEDTSSTISINSTAPSIQIKMAGKEDAAAETGFYNAPRTATITIHDREDSFVWENILITINGEPLDTETAKKMLSGAWPTAGADHTNILTFTDDGEYSWSISYSNAAGKSAEAATVEGNNVFDFEIDTTKPTGRVSVGETVWDSLLTKLTFGIYSSEKLTVNASVEDKNAVSMEYMISERDSALSEEILNNLYKSGSGNWKTLELKNGVCSVEVPEDVEGNLRFAVYFRAADRAGNYTFLSTDGAILDQEPSYIQLTPEKPNENGIYGSSYGDVVRVNVTVRENVKQDGQTPLSYYSGLRSVTWQVLCDGTETHSGEELFANTDEYGKLSSKFTHTIEVSTRDNNSSDVQVVVTATDNAGNTSTQSVRLDIDVTKPVIHVSFDNNAPRNGSFFSTKRTATIEIVERTNHFDQEAVLNSLKKSIKASDVNGKTLMPNYSIGEWSTAEAEDNTPDAARHSITITFCEGATYRTNYTCTDLAGNTSQGVNTGDALAPNEFTIDIKAPTGTVYAKISEDYTAEWTKLIAKDSFHFGIWTASNVVVTGNFQDETSPLESRQYYISDGSEALTEAALDALTAWQDFDNLKLTLTPNGQYTVYVKVVDNAGNTGYFSTNGIIVDDRAPVEERVEPLISITPPQPVNGLYNRDVPVNVSVIDPEVNKTYSGLNKVWYEVVNLDTGSVTQSGDLYSFGNRTPARNDLCQSWSKDNAILVDSQENNSNNVKVVVYASDNAGNQSREEIHLKIDVTKPQITVSYNNNAPDSGRYYSNVRTATITVKERNFSESDVVIKITNTDGVTPKISGWTEHKGTGNMDDTTHTATIQYAADGDYTFAASCIDLAGNACAAAGFAAGTANPTEFTIDRTSPVVTVSYDNNNVFNAKYFNGTRTATVTVVEHNFDPNRVNLEVRAARGGTVPNYSWSNSGDRHVAVLVFAEDGDYTFNVTMRDMAGNTNNGVNYGGSAAPGAFTVDTGKEMIHIDGVENGKAYGSSAVVIPEIRIEDANLEGYNVSLVGVQKGTALDLSDEVNALLKREGNVATGSLDLFDAVRERDGVYTLTVTASDLAGNQDEQKTVFTVNRFGSVYVYSDYLCQLIADGGQYVQFVEDDLVITEHNADKLLAGSLVIEITCDGRPLDNAQFTVTPEVNDTVSVGESGWYQYKYTISKENFSTDGVYKIAVSSKDATGNNMENVPENTENNVEDSILFRVDSTAPELTSVTGLEKAIINATENPVTYTAFDTIGLSSITVFVNGEANVISDFSDENNYTGSFDLQESSDVQSVRLVLEDKAGNILDTDCYGKTDENGNMLAAEPAFAFNRRVTISTNFFVRWYANKPLFWGVIGGIAAVCVLPWLLVFIKRKGKKPEEK